MAFNLKRVLKALLLSSSRPLAVTDIQAAFTRFHERDLPPPKAAETPAAEGAEPAGAEGPPAPDAPEEGAEPAELPAELTEDPELYQEVPALVTTAQVREAMDQIAAELRAANDGLLLIDGANGYRIVTHPSFGRWVRILRQEPPPLKLSQSSIETLAVVAYRQPVTRHEIETIRGVAAEAGLAKLLERELISITGRADQPGRPLQYGTTDAFLEFVGVRSLDELPASDVLTSRQIDEWLRTSANPKKPGDAEMGLGEELPLGQAPKLQP